jgi:vacuolar-type H+-ATPase subunit D/Vma8
MANLMLVNNVVFEAQKLLVQSASVIYAHTALTVDESLEKAKEILAKSFAIAQTFKGVKQ